MRDPSSLRFRCPACHAPGLVFHGHGTECPGCGTGFPALDGRSALLRPNHPLFPPDAYRKAALRPRARRRRWPLPSPSVNRAAPRLHAALARALAPQGGDVLVVGGGGQRHELERLYRAWPEIRLWFCDVDIEADVDFHCDALDLPFEDASFDGVITTAVLEHVLEPERAVAEITRVLRPGAGVYSEIPFLQQVHEGAYDFTRYTLSGHRWLFRGCEELDSGVVAGPGTALAWSLEHFAGACAPLPALRRPLRAIARILFFWIKYFDFVFGDSPAAIDAASCTYFLGRRRARGETLPGEIIARYAGANPRTHV